jgi:hypothetical protein
MRGCGHRRRASAEGSLCFEEIRLEALFDRLHGIVDGDLYQSYIDNADGTGPPRRDSVHRDLIPVDDGIAAATGMRSPRTGEKSVQDQASNAFHVHSSSVATIPGFAAAECAAPPGRA